MLTLIDQFDVAPAYSWYLDPFADQMSAWLPKQTTEQIRYAGHYTHLIRPGLRALVINTQYADTLNFYNYKNVSEKDPGMLIETTVKVLTEAEQAGERVMILGHIPPPGVASAWQDALVSISGRFHKTIIAHAYGHTHHDQFRVIHDGNQAYTVSYTAPAITTWSNQFPSVRLFKMNKTTNVIITN